MKKENLSKLSAYVPRIIEKIISDNNLCELPAYFESLQNAGIIFFDISGFTSITERVTSEGYYGVEVITNILNSYFDIMVPLIHKNGGSIVKFSGDAFLAMFPLEKTRFFTRMTAYKEEVAQCLSELNKQFQDLYNFEISIHGGYSYGQVKVQLVSNRKQIYDYIVIGNAVSEAYELCNQAQTGEILGNEIVDVDVFEQNRPSLLELAEVRSSLIESFITREVGSKLTEALFEAELRFCSILFVGIVPINNDFFTVEQLQRCYQAVSDVVATTGGMINKIDYTDKGYMLIITYGQLVIYDDQIMRAVKCAQELTKIEDKDFYFKIGFTTGSIYSGKIGSNIRAEFGIIGNAINISARLMSLCKANEVTFSQQILSSIRKYTSYNFIGKQKLKGIKDDIEVYKLSAGKNVTKSLYDNRYKDVKYVEIYKQLNFANMEKVNKVTAIYGDSGMGKSLSIYKILDNLDSNEFFLSELYEFNKYKIYGFIESLLSSIIGIISMRLQYEDIYKFAEDNNIVIDRTLLQNVFLNENANLSEAEMEIVDNFFVEVIYIYISQYKYLLIDNFDYIDSKSKIIVERLIKKLTNSKIKIILTSHSKLSSEIIESSLIENIELTSLDDEKSESYIRSQIPNISDGAVARLAKIANGNILNLTELCNQILSVKQGSLQIINNDNLNMMFKEGKIANSIESYYLRSYDKLNEEMKTILKIASIIGSMFQFEFVQNLSSQVVNKLDEDLLEHLCQGQYLRLHSKNPESFYVFKNQLFHQAVYKTIPLNEKIKYHKSIAQYLESKYEDSLKDYYEIIAQHFYFSKNKDKTAKYALLAAEKSLSLCLYNQCYYFCKMVISSKQDNAVLAKIIAIEVLTLVKRKDLAKQYIDEISDLVTGELICRYYYAQALYYFSNSDYSKVLSLSLDRSFCNDFYFIRTQLFVLDSYRFLNRKVDFTRLVKNIEKVLTKDSLLLVQLKNIYAQYYIDTSQFELSLKTYCQAIEVSQNINNKFNEKIASIGAGVACMNMGKLSKAKTYLFKAKEIAQNIGDITGLNRILLELAIIERKEGNKDKALATYQEIYVSAMDEGDLQHASTILYNIAEYYYSNEDNDSALEYLSKALKIQERINDKASICYSYDMMGDIYFSNGDLEKAESIYSQNINRQKEVGDNVGLAHSNMNLANILLSRKEFDKSLPLYLEQIRILESLKDVEGQGKANYNVGVNFYYLKDLDNCIKHLRLAEEKFIECNNKDLLASVQALLGKLVPKS